MEYKSTIKSRPYFYKETKIVAQLINKELNSNYIENINDIKIKAIKDNLFQVERETRRKEIASTVIRRLSSLNNYLIYQIGKSSIETSKIIVIYSIWKTDRLFMEFINEVFKEKIVLKDMYIRDSDFNIFFQSKMEQSERVNSWGEYTFKKLKQVYIKLLFESGLIVNQNGDREIRIPIIENDVRQAIIENGDRLFIEAIEGKCSI